MKNALVYFKEKSRLPFDELKSLEDIFATSGINFDRVEVLSLDDDLSFKRQLTVLKETMDNLFVFVSEDLEFDYKSIIAEVVDGRLFTSDVALKQIEEYVDKVGGTVREDYAYLPVDATIIPNKNGQFQGFMTEDKEFTLVVLPCGEENFTPMCSSFVIPYFENKYRLKKDKFTFKYFGSVAVLEKTLKDVQDEFSNSFTFRLKSLYGDCLAELIFLEGKEGEKPDVLRRIVSILKDNIYAEFDTTLSKRLFDVLSIKNVKISFAESFTAGRIVSSVINNSGASKYVNEGIVSYSNESKEKRLSVKKADLISVGAVSPEVAYQMAKGLLSDGRCDLAISTTGIAGPKSDDTLKPVGLCYIGIGTSDGIHVYKYNLSGDRETITETAKNTALFLAIKKLKNL